MKRESARSYSIYGSDVWFDVSDWRCFSPYSNILVVFRDGKVIAITSLRSGPDWRADAEKTLIDLPKRGSTDAPDDGKQSPKCRKTHCAMKVRHLRRELRLGICSYRNVARDQFR